jgi:hypothetical protein
LARIMLAYPVITFIPVNSCKIICPTLTQDALAYWGLVLKASVRVILEVFFSILDLKTSMTSYSSWLVSI